MLGLAGVAVVGYLVELAGGFRSLGVAAEWHLAATAIDVLFLVDLVAKVAILRGRYLRTPWCLVDVICTAPVLASLELLPPTLYGLRFVRAFRVLRVLRTLRGLRSLRMLQFAAQSTETLEQRTFDVVLAGSVLVYTAVFLGLVSWARSRAAEAGPDAAELTLVMGSLLGMVLTLVVARFQIPALWSRQMRALLNVALPQQVAEHLLRNPKAYDQTVRAPATVMFCDIKGFTSTVEALSLDQVKHHLERALDAVVEAHVAEDLIIDKYIGDSVMSFRGGNLVEGDAAEHALRVVRGALAGAAALRALGDPHFREVKVGGASAADALIGTFGTSKRLSYTILGDRVNLAARLEGSCNALGVQNLFCDRTHELVGERVRWRRVGRIKVQGREEPEPVWEALDVAPDWLPDFHAALALHDARDFAAAAAAFGALAGRDALSASYAATCAEWARACPADWSGVLVTRK